MIRKQPSLPISAHSPRRRAKWHLRRGFVLFVMLLLAPGVAHAHVKWFSKFNYAIPPRTLPEILSPLFWGFVVLSMVAVGILVPADRWLQTRSFWQHIVQWLDKHKDQSTLVIRIATGATMLLAWQADALLVPELHIDTVWIGWYQFVLALLLIFPQTTPLGGVGLGLLYGYAGWRFGPFAMLDYAHYLGIAGYLALSEMRNVRIRGLRLPLLYASVGFSLFWVGLEKLVYPAWSLYLLQQHPELALGFPPDFFLMGAAFVELALGYLLIIGLFGRPLALVITVVFFGTTMVFGKLEVIGHTPIHAALIVFLLHGQGTVYRPPIMLHRRLPLQVAFGAVNFAVLLAVLLFAYNRGAWYQHRNAIAQAGADPRSHVSTVSQASGIADMSPTVRPGPLFAIATPCCSD